MLLQAVKVMASLTNLKTVHLFLLLDWTLARKIWALEEHKMHLNPEDEDLTIHEDSVEKFMNTLSKWRYIVMMCKLDYNFYIISNIPYDMDFGVTNIDVLYGNINTKIQCRYLPKKHWYWNLHTPQRHQEPKIKRNSIFWSKPSSMCAHQSQTYRESPRISQKTCWFCSQARK